MDSIMPLPSAPCWVWPMEALAGVQRQATHEVAWVAGLFSPGTQALVSCLYTQLP